METIIESMKVYKIELMIIDFDQIGESDIKSIIENTHYPNYCINPQVKNIESRDISDWTDEHSLNLKSTSDAEFQRLFSKNEQS